jgi:hypothetical protein
MRSDDLDEIPARGQMYGNVLKLTKLSLRKSNSLEICRKRRKPVGSERTSHTCIAIRSCDCDNACRRCRPGERSARYNQRNDARAAANPNLAIHADLTRSLPREPPMEPKICPGPIGDGIHRAG